MLDRQPLLLFRAEDGVEGGSWWGVGEGGEGGWIAEMIPGEMWDQSNSLWERDMHNMRSDSVRGVNRKITHKNNDVFHILTKCGKLCVNAFPLFALVFLILLIPPVCSVALPNSKQTQKKDKKNIINLIVLNVCTVQMPKTLTIQIFHAYKIISSLTFLFKKHAWVTLF